MNSRTSAPCPLPAGQTVAVKGLAPKARVPVDSKSKAAGNPYPSPASGGAAVPTDPEPRT